MEGHIPVHELMPSHFTPEELVAARTRLNQYFSPNNFEHEFEGDNHLSTIVDDISFTEAEWELARPYLLELREEMREMDRQIQQEPTALVQNRHNEAEAAREWRMDETMRRIMEEAHLHPDNVQDEITLPHNRLMRDIQRDYHVRRGAMDVEESGGRRSAKGYRVRNVKKTKRTKKRRITKKTRITKKYRNNKRRSSRR